jgi:hypothetical protein
MVACEARMQLQDYKHVEQAKRPKLTPGGTLSMTCMFNTVGITNVVSGGAGPDDAACEVILLVIPRPSTTSQCISSQADMAFDKDSTWDSQCNLSAFPATRYTSTGTGGGGGGETGDGDGNGGTKAPNTDKAVSSSLTGAPIWMDIHGLTMAAAWVMVIPFAISFPVLFKSRTDSPVDWLQWHRVLIAVGLSMVFVSTVFVVANTSMEHFSTVHGKLGISTVAFAFLQALFGLLRPSKGDVAAKLNNGEVREHKSDLELEK